MKGVVYSRAHTVALSCYLVHDLFKGVDSVKISGKSVVKLTL